MAETAERKVVKAGWKTSEFWMSAGGMLLPLLHDALPPTWKAALATAAGAVYAIARAISKRG